MNHNLYHNLFVEGCSYKHDSKDDRKSVKRKYSSKKYKTDEDIEKEGDKE